MNTYNVVSFDFTRNDGLVTVKVRPKITNQINTVIISKIKNYQLLKEKYRCLKSDIQNLKALLKRSYNVREFREFYRIYGPKLIEIDFGFIELFNLKGENQFSIEEIYQFKKDVNFMRWGKLFTISQLERFKDGSSVQDQIVGLQFYNMLVKERIYTLRTLRYYKNDVERKKFPYQFLYIYDLEDSLQINLSSFQEYLSQIQDEIYTKTKMQEQQLPSLKIQFFKKQFQNFQFQNIIAPFLQLKFDEQKLIQLFFIHFNLSGYQIKNYQNSNDDQLEKKELLKYKCYIFVNHDTTFYSYEQLRNGAIEFANIHDFTISNSDILFINIKNQENNFLEEYVKYIESEFFLPEISIERQMNYIFNELPKEISKKPFNSILDEKFIIPQNIQNIMKQLSGELK
ncbi:unnamed protein product [Paramecium pentaurelia]|uniref:Uncharacterized protein n=1 Tax=Paramecium pentaurelia TaxID=43138 RepID=A0A8S1UNK2_9CILI|nr:unnamed protein product [Paramecium pentaurelia]